MHAVRVSDRVLETIRRKRGDVGLFRDLEIGKMALIVEG
jgi:hypothetical protein